MRFGSPDRGGICPILAATLIDRDTDAQGCFLETPELIQAATGRPLTLDPFLAHLERRYLA